MRSQKNAVRGGGRKKGVSCAKGMKGGYRISRRKQARRRGVAQYEFGIGRGLSVRRMVVVVDCFEGRGSGERI